MPAFNFIFLYDRLIGHLKNYNLIEEKKLFYCLQTGCFSCIFCKSFNNFSKEKRANQISRRKSKRETDKIFETDKMTSK